MNRTLVSCTVALVSFVAFAKVELATPFNDGMVLQRDRAVPVWGQADSGARVVVSFAGQKLEAKADARGGWRVDLNPMKASKEGRTLTVSAGGDTCRITDVLVGEVWFCSGQSNTDCPIWGPSPHYRDGQGAMIMQMTMKPFVRLVKTPLVGSAVPRFDYRAKWMKMTPQTLSYDSRPERFPSAMGYLFAFELANSLDIPVGLIDSSWGGTNIDSWTPPSGYQTVPALSDVAALPCLPKAEFDVSRTNGVYKSARNASIYGKNWIQQPTALWNGMVAAYAPMAIRGLIWYQGCHNSSEPDRYCDKLHALYNGWAKEFGNSGLRFYFVQLAPFGNGFCKLQMAQSKFAAEEENAAISVINDVGCLTDIHPNDKRTVARRLALHALKRDYGFDWIVDDSPTVKDWRIENGKFVLSFRNVREWHLYNEDWSLANGFEITGTNGVWTAARIEGVENQQEAGKQHGKCRGTISGTDLVVSAEGVDAPVRLRYLFQKPFKGNLYNEMDLPLGVFEVGAGKGD